MANATKAEAIQFAEAHERTAKQIREHMKNLKSGTEAFASNDREAYDHERRAAGWREYASHL